MESDELWSCRQLLSHLESQLLEVSTSPSQVLRNAIAADLLFVVLNFEWMKSDEIKDRIFAIVATLNNCSTLVPILIALLCNVENAKNHKDKINFQHFLKLVVESYPEEVSSSLNEALQNGDQIDFLLGVILGVLKMDEYVATSACSGKLLTTLTLLLKRKSFATESVMIIGEIVTLIVPRALEKSLFLLHSLFQLLTLLLEEHVRHEKCAKQDASNSFNTQSCIWSRLFHMLIVLSPWNTVLFVRDLMCDDKAIAPCITAEVQKIRMPSNMFISDDVASKEVVQMSAEEFEAQLTALRINTMAQRPASPTKIRPVAIAPPPPPCNLWCNIPHTYYVTLFREKFDSVNSPARSTPPPTLLPTFDSQDAERNSQYSPRLDSPRSRSSMSPTYGRLKHNGITSDDALTLAALSLTETQVTPTSPTITRQPTFERQFLSFASRMDSNMTDDSTTLAPGGETSRRTP